MEKEKAHREDALGHNYKRTVSLFVTITKTLP